MRLADHVAPMGENKNSLKGFSSENVKEGRVPLGIPRSVWEDNIKMFVTQRIEYFGTGCGVLRTFWIHKMRQIF